MPRAQRSLIEAVEAARLEEMDAIASKEHQGDLQIDRDDPRNLPPEEYLHWLEAQREAAS